MSVFGRGILIRGDSGTGKSELALELISRGHQLVADDTVRIGRRGDKLYGEPPSLTSGVIALNGLGLVYVAAVFGEEALLPGSNIDLCIDLTPAPSRSDHALGMRASVDILGVEVPQIELDVSKVRPGPVVIETAVRLLDRPSALAGSIIAAEHDDLLIRTPPIPQ